MPWFALFLIIPRATQSSWWCECDQSQGLLSLRVFHLGLVSTMNEISKAVLNHHLQLSSRRCVLIFSKYWFEGLPDRCWAATQWPWGARRKFLLQIHFEYFIDFYLLSFLQLLYANCARRACFQRQVCLWSWLNINYRGPPELITFSALSIEQPLNENSAQGHSSALALSCC